MMTTWYQIRYGAIVREETFEDREKAEKFAHRLTCETGHKWHAELVCGIDW